MVKTNKQIEKNYNILNPCQVLTSSINAFLLSIANFNSETLGSIETSITFMYKSYERLWQTSRIVRDNGHIKTIGKDNQYYALSSFLNEIKKENNASDFSKNKCDYSCDFCDKCSFCTNMEHLKEYICLNSNNACVNCENDTFISQCNKCNILKPNHVFCNKCAGETCKKSLNATNPERLHGLLSEISKKAEIYYNLELLRNIRNHDTHGYLETGYSSNRQLTEILLPYYRASIYNYLPILDEITLDVVKCCDKIKHKNCTKDDLLKNLQEIRYKVSLPSYISDISQKSSNSKNTSISQIRKEIQDNNNLFEKNKSTSTIKSYYKIEENSMAIYGVLSPFNNLFLKTYLNTEVTKYKKDIFKTFNEKNDDFYALMKKLKFSQEDIDTFKGEKNPNRIKIIEEHFTRLFYERLNSIKAEKLSKIIELLFPKN